MKGVALAIALFFLAPAANAGLSHNELSAVGISLPPGARLDLNFAALDDRGRARTLRDILDGKPAFVTFADYTCTSLCGADLRLLSTAIENSSVGPGDYHLIVIGIDPKDTNQAADKMADEELSAEVRAATVLLLPEKHVLTGAVDALGFHYAYDTASDQFAHPAVVYVLTSSGVVSSVQSPFALDPTSIKTETAASSSDTSLYDRIRTLCYALDPATGTYTLRILRLLKVGAAFTLFLLAAGIAIFARAQRGAR